MLSLDIYRVISAEQQIFEQELVHRQRYQEAKLAEAGTSNARGGGISRLAASIRNVVRTGPAATQVTATVLRGTEAC